MRLHSNIGYGLLPVLSVAFSTISFLTVCDRRALRRVCYNASAPILTPYDNKSRSFTG